MNPASNILGTLSADNLTIQTHGITRATFGGTPSATIPVLAFTNTTAGIQGVRINGSLDAAIGNTLAANPGVWDLAVDGDEVVTGIFKTGGSLWFDGNSATHSITANKPLNIRTTSNDSIVFGTHGATRMTIGKNGFVGVGTMNPVSKFQVTGTPPDPTFKNAQNLYTPDPFNHVLTVENMATNAKGNGIAVIIHNPTGTIVPNQSNSDGVYNNNASNYMTYYNDNEDHNHIKGRIEGFSYENYLQLKQQIDAIQNNTDIYNPFSYFTFNVGYNSDWISFDPNFIHFTPPSWNFSIGSLPSLTWCDIFIGITLTGIPYPCPGLDPSTWADICYADIDVGGTVSYPCGISGGSWPSFSGSIGSLSFTNPVTINGSPLTNLTSPFSVNYDFINSIASQLRDLPYKEKAAMILTNKIAAAVNFGLSFLGGVTYESGSGDYAEWLERADHHEKINIGDVVGVVGDKISKTTDGANRFMVVSWKPCVLGNMPEEGKEQFYQKVAFMGQVPVKIACNVKKGDYIIPSGHNDGFATTISPENMTADDLGKVLGVAWEDAPRDKREIYQDRCRTQAAGNGAGYSKPGAIHRAARIRTCRTRHYESRPRWNQIFD